MLAEENFLSKSSHSESARQRTQMRVCVCEQCSFVFLSEPALFCHLLNAGVKIPEAT